MNKNEELQKWLNDDRYVQIEDLATLWNLSVSSIRGRIRKRKIKSTKRISLGQSGHYAFYDKHDCEMLLSAMEQKKQEIEDWSRDTRLLDISNIARAWNMSNKAACAFLGRKGIKPIKKANLGKYKGCCAYYDRAECERARPFINQPEQKEVEKVEEVNLLESELGSEELASENGSALNDAELAAITTACKDPVDKIMILSVLCFGVKSGELSSLNLRDISGADICLQSPSGVVKMRIPKQYEDARTDLITYYVDNGNNLSGDMPVFLNRSGIRMTRQGLNNRMKSVSESANIGRDVKLSDLRATFAQNIYKKTEKNIASVHKYLRLSENTNIMGYLLETQSKEQKTMPVDLMNSLTASYQSKKPPTIAEPTEQAPDIIPADTIDLFTMSELESELKNRGVELTAEVRNKINTSDMPEMQHIAKMLRGNAKTITIRLSVLNEIAEQLRGFVENNDTDQDFERDKKAFLTAWYVTCRTLNRPCKTWECMSALPLYLRQDQARRTFIHESCMSSGELEGNHKDGFCCAKMTFTEKKEEPNAAMLIDRLDAKLCQIDSAMNQLRVESAEIRRLVAEIKLAISPQLC